MTPPAATSGSLADLPADEPYPGVVRRTVDGEGLTASTYRFEPGASFPVHRHAQEQLTIVHEGSVSVQLGEEATALGAGSWWVVPGWVEHGLTAGSDGASLTAVIVPRRTAPPEIIG